MASLTIDLPDTMKDFIESKASERGYSDPAEFVVELVRACQTRDSIDRELLAAIESDRFEEVTPALWQRLRDRLPETGEIRHDG